MGARSEAAVRLRSAFALFLPLLTIATSGVEARELWIVNETSRTLRIVDADTESDTGVSVDLDDPGDPGNPDADPFDICFARFARDALVGEYAFVTQGPVVRVVRVPSRTIVDTYDVSAALGSPVELRGCSAAPPREFVDASGTTVTRSHLYVAANVETREGGSIEPYFLVLDQSRLASVAGGGAATLITEGPLLPPAFSDGGSVDYGPLDALRVEALERPRGDEYEAAWFTVREDSPSATQHAVRVATPSTLTDGWTVRSTRSHAVPDPALVGLNVSAPKGGPMPVVYEADAAPDYLLNLDTGGRCSREFPLPEYQSGSANAAAGPGSCDYEVGLVSAPSGLSSPGTFTLVNAATCDTRDFDVDVEPVDVVVQNEIRPEKWFVVHRGTDSVGVIRADGTSGSIALAPPPPFAPGGADTAAALLDDATDSSLLGSISGALVPNAGATCGDRQDVSLSIEARDPDGIPNDVVVSWSNTGCPESTTYTVFCRCVDEDPATCPPGCVPSGGLEGAEDVLDPGSVLDGCTIGDDWITLDTTSEGEQTETVHADAGDDSGAVEYKVSPDASEPASDPTAATRADASSPQVRASR